MWCLFFFFKQKTADEMRISDWSSDVCSSDLTGWAGDRAPRRCRRAAPPTFNIGHTWSDEQSPGQATTVVLHQRNRARRHPFGVKIGRASCRERVCQYV